MSGSLSRKYQLFVDLDGVLVDFETGVRRATGKEPSELHSRSMWPAIAGTKDFYDRLGWMPDGRDLWQVAKDFQPVILTGLPMGKWAEPQKRSWCERELGPDIPVITGMSRRKAELALTWLEENRMPDKTPILIDDRLKIKEPWEAAGGIFILHLSAAGSIEELKGLGFLI
ncbi:MAG: hypothetical protein J7L76_01685 [Spirochaetaceae bacterium]|nr:hypothetical protein [Spirochaetaceae bacterium]RKX73342.1 MAG: hypothetical protein DRP60_12050 [Spirochaetota bacterium]